MRTLAVFMSIVLLPGCVQPYMRPSSAQLPEPVKVVIPPPVIKDGSLWQGDVATSSLTSDIKAHSVGDVVTVQVVEVINATRKRNTSTERDQTANASVDNVTLPGAAAILGAAAGKFRQASIAGGSKRSFNGGGTITDSGDVQATITTQVIEVLPNGNLVLQGSKEVSVSGEVQIVTLTGIARPKDVSPDNQLLSTSLAEARIHITGSGPLNEAQRRTLVGRLFDWINLF